jgi:hypothetical protein
MTETLETRYPHVAEWVFTHGWIEIGQDDHSQSLVRALDSGGMVWEGADDYSSLDALMEALDAALAVHMRERFGE